MFKKSFFKIFVSSVSILTVIISIFICCIPSASAAYNEEAATVIQNWASSGSHIEYHVQSSGNAYLDGSAVAYTQPLTLTTSSHFTGAGNYHGSFPYKRMTFLRFHMESDKPQFVLGAQYKYKYNCLMDFYMKNYLKDGTISLFVSVKTNNSSGLIESFTYSLGDIRDSYLAGHSFDPDSGKFTINFANMFPTEVFDGTRWVSEVDVSFYWMSYTSTNQGGTYFIPRQTYVPYFSDVANADIFPEWSEDNISSWLEGLKYYEEAYTDLNLLTDLYADFVSLLEALFPSFLFITDIFNLFISRNSMLYPLFVSSLAIGLTGFIITGVSLIRKL